MPLTAKKKPPKPPPVVELTPEGGENLTPGKLNMPMPYAVYPVVTLTPTGGSATKGKRQKRKRKKRKRKHKRKRKTHGHGGDPFAFGSGKDPFLFGSTKDPFLFGSTKDPFGFSVPKSKGKRKKKKKRKGKRHKKKGKKGKIPTVVLTQRGGYTANVKHPKPNLAPLPLKHTASTRYTIEDNLFHRARTHKQREHFRFRAGLISRHRSAKLGNRHFRFREGLEPKKRRQRKLRVK